ncbi:MAG: hypothetical protein Q4C64_02380 [Erysipelotrichia bacterium]|nr:hypothetical protein [Erysipelotrichia bacterium]
MKEILKIIEEQMTALSIEYYYLYNNAPTVVYPYVTGEFTQNGYSYEDNSNSGDMLLECWNRGSQINLINLHQKIKEHFRDLQVSKDNVVAHISYNSAYPVRTDDADLFKMEIHLDITYWEGEKQ